jgi:GDPmannose 4,6-dehydratase
MLQQNEPDDYVMATGVTTSVRDFITMAFGEAEINIQWSGKGIDEKGIDAKTGAIMVEIDPKYFRPAEVELLIGDPSKAMKKLGWKPRVQLPELIKMMVESDLKEAEQDRHLLRGGYEVKQYHE